MSPDSQEPAPSCGPLTRRLFRIALASYPTQFRNRLGRSMEDTFFEAYRVHRAKGVLASWWFAGSTLLNVWVEGRRERHAPSFAETLPHRAKKGSVTMWLGYVWKELCVALRSCWRRPGFTIVAVVTLALGVGANTAIFSVVNGVVLQPLPYVDSEQLVAVRALWRGPRTARGAMSYPDLADLETESSALESLVGVSGSNMTLTGLGDPAVVEVTRVTKGLMDTFRVAPAVGRDIRADEFGVDGPAVAVLGHGFWQAHFGGRHDVLGEGLDLDGTRYQVVGVAPPGFDYPNGAELWIPRRLDLEDCGRGCHTMTGVGRLRAGTDLAQVQREADRIASDLSEAYPDSNTNKSFLVRTLQDYVVGDVRQGLLLLLGAVGLVVLIACANVANLLLVRASARTGEVAIRTAVGASRMRLLVQTWVESLVLASLGGLAGLGLAAGSLALLRRLATGIPRMEGIVIDDQVLWFTLATVVISTFLFGTVPAWLLVRSPVRSGLASATPGSGGESPGRRRFRGLLLASEVALSAMLLIGAGLLLRSFAALYDVDVGFQTRDVTRFSLTLPPDRYDEMEKIRRFYRDLEARLAALPGVEAVGSVWGPPLGSSNVSGVVLVEGRPKPKPEEELEASMHSVGPGWLETMGIPIVRGRGLRLEDDTSPIPVAVVNETFVREIFPGEEPIDRELRVTVSFGFGSPTWRIVGVVGDVRSRSLDAEPRAQIYVPHGHFGPEDMTVTIRSRPSAGSVLPAANALLRELDPAVPMYRVETISEVLSQQTAPTRFYLVFASIFAALAAVLAAVGLYGVVAYTASRRTREIALRLALGAPRNNVSRMVLLQGMAPAAMGLGIGLVAAYFAAHWMESVLFGVDPRDPWIFLSASVLLSLVALAATLVPARRASRIDPAWALRFE